MCILIREAAYACVKPRNDVLDPLDYRISVIYLSSDDAMFKAEGAEKRTAHTFVSERY